MATPGGDFYCEYDLGAARRHGGGQPPAPHQQQALLALDRWYRADAAADLGGILGLPTGGGKTFTAGQFVCPLDGRPQEAGAVKFENAALEITQDHHHLVKEG